MGREGGTAVVVDTLHNSMTHYTTDTLSRVFLVECEYNLKGKKTQWTFIDVTLIGIHVATANGSPDKVKN